MNIELLSPTVVAEGERTAAFLRLLADPTRQRILTLLLRGETCNCEIGDELGLAQNLISHHVRQLREAGLVRERRDPHDHRWIYYTVDADAYRVAWGALEAVFGPAFLGTRAPVCGPAALPSGSMAGCCEDNPRADRGNRS